ncbi:MAG: hypothetical protein K9W43_10310 [Candidatus Thorarchaeota archaeon]|nr:hypothetical protein [Candidatus Thorarchaeota archaeon]
MKEEQTKLQEFHRKFATETNNAIWSILDKDAPDEKERDEALGLAFTSRFHWSKIGTIVHRARAEYMISRVYNAMRLGELALAHATTCLDLIQSKDEIAITRADKGLVMQEPVVFADFDLPFAYEALARAHAVLGDGESCKSYVALAKKAIAKVQDPENRKICTDELEKVECP